MLCCYVFSVAPRMPLNRKWRSMDFFGSHESLNKSESKNDKNKLVSNLEKNKRPLSIHKKTDHHSHFPVQNPFRNRLTSIGSHDQQPASPNRKPVQVLDSGLTQKCIIIQRDDKGYGFTVSGDNPVYVASVKPDGAAARAGVQHGDRIIKVNGAMVTQRNHLDVVKLIKSGGYVALTLLGKHTVSAEGGLLTSVSDFVSSKDSVIKLTDPSSDLCSMSDSPLTSPCGSPAPTESAAGHNRLDKMHVMTGASQIIHIDDEEVNSGDDEVCEAGPFADIGLLEKKPAHMAVFLNYLISNSDPSHVLFYIMSDLYQRSNASNKELRKWAYEIFSTFIHKLAPLSISVEDNIISQIDNILVSSCNKTDNENLLRAMFQVAKQSLQTEIADSLREFTIKKNLGMGSLYGIHNVHDNMDRPLEIQVVEELLMPHVRSFSLERHTQKLVSDRDLAIGWALATYIRCLGGSKSTHSAQLDSILTFMMKDKRSIKFPGSRSNRAKAIRGHQFNLQHLYMSTFCNLCGKFIWGVGYQAYQCHSCDIVLHKVCADDIKEHCGGKHKKRHSVIAPAPSVAPVIIHKQPSISAEQVSHAVTASQKSDPKVTPAAGSVCYKATQPNLRHDNSLDIGSTLSIIAGLHGGHAVKSLIGRYQGVTSPTGTAADSMAQQSVEDSGSKDRRGSTDIVRSGSLSRKEETNKPARRANSDITLDTDTYKSLNHSGSSSNSSISNRSLESPRHGTDSVSETLRAQHEDVDLDVEPELPPLKQLLPEDILRKLKPKEKKRQEVINELFYTERAHLRNLKVLDLLFNRPMQQEKGIMKDLAAALFPNMEDMISIHVTFVSDIKERQQAAPIVKDVGDLLLQQFDGECGNRFRQGCAEYCRNQVFALEVLKKQTRKEPKLQQFLHDAESNPLCRRLQLKDLVPSQMQRLTKYPLLIDSLLKYTQSSSEEYRRLERALDRCKHILAYVNTAVKECENYHKLKDIQKRLDTRPVDGLNDPALAYLKNLDVMQHKLIFDGSLTWKLRTHRTLDIHVLLFEDLLVLLHKLDDRYVLKCQNTNAQQIRDDKYTHYPVLKLQNLLARTVATEKKSFFVVNMSESRAQMYEFTAASSELRLKWCKLINDRADDLKKTVKLSSPKDFIGIDRNRPSRISRKVRHTSSAVSADQGSSPMQQDLFIATKELPQSLQAIEDLRSETELIFPEEVSILDVVTSQALTCSSPVVLTATSAGLGNVDLPQTAVAAAMTAAAATATEAATTSAAAAATIAAATTTAAAGLGHGNEAACLLQQHEEDKLREKYGLSAMSSNSCDDAGDVSEPEGHMHQGIEESTVVAVEESVQPLGSSSESTDVLQVIALQTAADLIRESTPDENILGDDDDDDEGNVVSVADLPLPDVTSDMMLSHHDNVGVDDDTENDDLDTLIFKTDDLDLCSLTTTVEDIDGEEREVEIDIDVLCDTSQTLRTDITDADSCAHTDHLDKSSSESVASMSVGDVRVLPA